MSIDEVEHVGAVLGSPREGAAADFFSAITESGSLPPGIEVEEATSAVSCALLRRLDLQPARLVLDALPPPVVSVIGRCPIHGGATGERFDVGEFSRGIGEHLQLAPEAIASMAGAVLRALRAQLPSHVNAVVERQLPRELLALWRGGART